MLHMLFIAAFIQTKKDISTHSELKISDSTLKVYVMRQKTFTTAKGEKKPKAIKNFSPVAKI